MAPPVSDALPHARGQDSELVPVLGHGAAGDLDPVGLEEVHDRLIGEGPPFVFLFHELLDLGLNPPGADVLAAGRGQSAGEEELQRIDAAWRLDELLVRDA